MMVGGCLSSMIPYWVSTVDNLWTSDVVTRARTDTTLSLSLDNFRVIQHKMDATPETYGKYLPMIRDYQKNLDLMIDKSLINTENMTGDQLVLVSNQIA